MNRPTLKEPPLSSLGMTAGLLLVLALLCYGRALLPGYTFVGDVLFRYFLGSYSLLKQALAAGELPFWNPYLSSGVPFLANSQSSVFYPASYLFAVFPFGLALKLFIVLHAVLAGVFMTLLASHFKLKVWPARFAGILYAFNGFAVLHYHLPVHLQVYAWAPLLSYTYCRLAAAPSRRRSAAAAAVTAVILVGGYIPSMIYAMGIAILLAFATRQRKVPATLRSLTLVILLGVALAAVQWAPTLQFALESSRAHGSSHEWIFAKSLHWKEMAQMLFYPLWSWYLHFDFDISVAGFYWGLPALFLAFWAMKSSPRSRLHGLLLGIFGLGLILSAGQSGLLYPLLVRFVWPFSWLRYPSNALFLSCFALPLLAAIGLERFGKRAAWLWMGLCVLDLGLFAQRAYEPIKSSFYSFKPPTTTFLENRQDVGRIYMTPPTASSLGRRGKDRYEAFTNFTDSLLPNYATVFKLHDAAGGTELELERYSHVLEEINRSANSPWLHVVGARYILSFWDLPNLRTLFDGPSGIKVVENKSALPRAYFTPCASYGTAEQTLAEITNGILQPAACISINDTSAPVTTNNPSPGVPVQVQDISPNHIRLNVQTTQPGWVLLSDTFDTGWSASSGGEPVSIFRANYIQQAVAVKAGTTTLDWQYRPPYWLLSVACSSVAFIALVLLLI